MTLYFKSTSKDYNLKNTITSSIFEQIYQDYLKNKYPLIHYLKNG